MGYIPRAGGGKSRDAVVSQRYYLNDADFLVGLEGDATLLEELDKALQRPAWHIFLGRKACIPSVPVWVPGGVKTDNLEEALRRHPWPRLLMDIPDERTRPTELKLVIEESTGVEARTDQPTSFADRTFRLRYTATRFLCLGEDVPIRSLEET